jgi:hypothetical protein
MTRLTRAILFGFLACVLATAACGGGAPAEEEATAAAPDAAAVAAASRLASKLGSDVKLVPTIRGMAEIGYTQPQARRESNFIITTIRVKNLAENAIAGFQVDEFWFDQDGNTVTGDRFRLREPLLSGEVIDVELQVPRSSAMDRSNYEFSHQNGDIKATMLDEIEDPVVEEEEAQGEEPEEEPPAR